MRSSRPIYCTFALCFAIAGLAEARNPNVVIFLTDDPGWGDLSINGNTNLSTPNVDSLAREGVRFENLYVCTGERPQSS